MGSENSEDRWKKVWSKRCVKDSKEQVESKSDADDADSQEVAKMSPEEVAAMSKLLLHQN